MAGRKKDKKKSEWIYMLPVGVVLAVVPLLTHAHVYKAVEGYLYSGVESASLKIDFISYYKSVFLLIGAAAMVLFLLYRVLTEENGKGAGAKNSASKYVPRNFKVWIPLFLYALLAFLSACFSEFKQYAFGGMDGTYESVWVLLAYVVTAFYTFFMLDSESCISKLLFLFRIGMSLLCFYGIVELLFGNPLGWDSAKYWLYSGDQLAAYGDNREAAFDGLTLTFYNSNYVASLLALTIPISLAAVFQEEKKSNKIWSGILFFLEWVMLIACKARSGLFAVILSFLILAVLFRTRLLKHGKWVLAGFAVVLAGYLLVEIPNGFSYSRRFITLFDMESKEADLKKIETLADSVEITYRNHTLSLRYHGLESEKPFTVMCDGKEIVYTKQDGIWETEDSRFAQIQLAVTGNAQLDYFDVGISGLGWRFIDIKDSGGYYYINPAHYPVKLETAEKAFPARYWRFGSGRGYIWAKAVPLLKKYPVIGSGPDTFYMVYPWNDYVDQSAVTAKEKVFKRPHSMYLQMGIQTGGLSLAAFLVFAGWYAVSSIKLYGKRNKEGWTGIELLGAGIFVGVAGYLITGLVNDSMIGVAQFFWCFTGMGFAINEMVKRNRKEA